MNKTVAFEMCSCGAVPQHGYFFVDGNKVGEPIGSIPNGQRVLAQLVEEHGLTDEEVAEAKAQMEAAGLAAEVLEQEKAPALPPELAKLLSLFGGNVRVIRF
jgi:hypothetical protein